MPTCMPPGINFCLIETFLINRAKVPFNEFRNTIVKYK